VGRHGEGEGRVEGRRRECGGEEGETNWGGWGKGRAGEGWGAGMEGGGVWVGVGGEKVHKGERGVEGKNKLGWVG